MSNEIILHPYQREMLEKVKAMGNRDLLVMGRLTGVETMRRTLTLAIRNFETLELRVAAANAAVDEYRRVHGNVWDEVSQLKKVSPTGRLILDEYGGRANLTMELRKLGIVRCRSQYRRGILGDHYERWSHADRQVHRGADKAPAGPWARTGGDALLDQRADCESPVAAHGFPAQEKPYLVPRPRRPGQRSR